MPKNRYWIGFIGLCTFFFTYSAGAAVPNQVQTYQTLNQEVAKFPKSAQIVVGDQSFMRPILGSWKSKINVYQAVLPVCTTQADEVCIETVKTRTVGSVWNEAKAIHPIGHQELWMDGKNLQTTWPVSMESALPPGSEPWLWEFNEPHSGGKLYQVNAVFQKIQGDPGAGQFNLGVVGVADTQSFDVCKLLGGNLTNYKSDINTHGISTAFCPVYFNLPSDLEIRITVRFGFLKPLLIGWMDSHSLNSTIDIGESSITFTGQSVKTPVMASKIYSYDEIGANSDLCDAFSCTSENAYNGGPLEKMPSFLRYWKGNEQNWTLLYRKIPGLVESKSLQDVYTWGFSTSQYKISTYCKSSQQLLGLISTNATIYNPAPPKWDQNQNSLSFEASAPHYASDSSTTLGYYSVKLDAGYAKCLWKSDLKNAKAELSVIYDDGTTNIATTTINNNDQWVTFTAASFHYSSPKFSARIVTSKPTQSKQKSISITCIKGSFSKVITGEKPVCPAGFKKK